MPAEDFNTFEHLFRKGVRYKTVIDVGCADGHYFLSLMHYFPNAAPLNIDANSLYESSLREIKDVLGGDYRICAVADRAGEMELVESVHPYWSSLRPEGDPYWLRVNNLMAKKTMVPVATLDSIVAESGLSPPFLLKLDVQGAELTALAGAKKVLPETHVILVECDIADFQQINALLTGANFFLYDIAALSRTSDGTLGWFYAFYVNNALADDLQPKAFWSAEGNAAAIEVQAQRRETILKAISQALAYIRASRPA
jgi:FkbM family methyltransferase